MVWLGASTCIPALFTRPYSAPFRVTASSASETLASSTTSHARFTKRASSSGAKLVSGPRPPRERHATRNPRVASSTAIAAPIPRLAPVTAINRPELRSLLTRHPFVACGQDDSLGFLWIDPAHRLRLNAFGLCPLGELAFEDLSAGSERKLVHGEEVLGHVVFR